ncbi:branched-chain amino acid ABC transporter substrate-binding protein [Acuticoccus sp. I52.16.1]|uniref:branched-chain amino acid ABC transporter substrate-binding protein n=1 Tax=Acuticoccus sp. I52.16.1 TaxID=2928472 RepID=UPI001FD2210C|nr:branched-chain amino acid ABC transporter substrate-binding protein [Acuticoccus sp. I52.16.1]UOM33023.1 branched-chain amino acid ABC transporter substrate-binding protein [Acuticoccus sp. I52.16.1]
MKKFALASAATFALLVSSAAMTSAHAQDEAFRIAYVEGMSGPFANVGDQGLKHFTHAIEKINAAGGINGKQVEVKAFDGQTNPRESLVQLQRAIDEGYQYVTQGNGSSIASALIDGIEKHNKRNPDQPVLFLNYAAVDPAFTNDRCSFWHFRFDADADMKMNAITDWLESQPDIKSVYIIGQDYSFGKAVADAAVAQLGDKRPDVEVVGNELHPLGKVKDFTPYVQKIMSSGADAVITGNWGADMQLLIKAASEAGLEAPFLTYYGGGLGAVTAMGQSAVGRVMQVSEFHENLDATEDQIAEIKSFEDEAGLDYYYLRIFTLMDMLKAAAESAGSNEPTAVAKALEGLTYESPYGAVSMRADNHQLLQDLYISILADDVEGTVEGTPFGFKTVDDGMIQAAATETETTCKMDRPD